MSKTATELNRRSFLKLGGAAAAAATAAGAGVADAQNNSPVQSYAGTNNYAGKVRAPGDPKPWNIPQKPGPPISIDVHTHWAPQAYMDLKAKFGTPDHSSPSNYDMESRIRWMDANGEKMQVLTLGGFMPWVWVTPEQGAEIAKVVNNASMEVLAKYPDRFLAGIEIPVNAPDLALKELDRVQGKPGMVALHLPNSLAGREYLFEDSFAPVLARCDELKLPLLLHPLDGEGNWFAGTRLADAYSGKNQPALFPGLTNTAGETFEQATTISKLIVSGTLDKYPNLQIVAAHSGGAFPFIVSRIDWRGADRGLKHPFIEYTRRFYFDSLSFYPPVLQFLIEMVGSDRVVIGTDNMGAPAPPAPGVSVPGVDNRPRGGPNSVLDQLTLTPGDRDLILRGNLQRLFKLKTT